MDEPVPGIFITYFRNHSAEDDAIATHDGGIQNKMEPGILIVSDRLVRPPQYMRFGKPNRLHIANI